jgi:hypothetical protein
LRLRIAPFSSAFEVVHQADVRAVLLEPPERFELDPAAETEATMLSHDGGVFRSRDRAGRPRDAQLGERDDLTACVQRNRDPDVSVTPPDGRFEIADENGAPDLGLLVEPVRGAVDRIACAGERVEQLGRRGTDPAADAVAVDRTGPQVIAERQP